jgi:hypothetical protein
VRSLLIRCYPASWRQRYEDEFLAVLEERPLGPFDIADILLGALDARLGSRRPRAAGSHGRSLSMSLRIGGFAATLGAVLWAVAGLLSTGVAGAVSDSLPVAMLMAGMIVMLVAMAGLSAFQARTHPGAIWAAFAVTVIGTVAFFVGYAASIWVGDEGFWGLWFIGTLTVIVGSGLFATVTYQTRVFPRPGPVLIGIGIGVILADAILNTRTLIPIGMAGLAIGWFVLGVQAIRADRPATATHPV